MSLASLRQKLATDSPSWQLCLLGIIGGALAGLTVIALKFSVLAIQSFYLESPDDFTTLSDSVRSTLPFIGATITVVAMWLIGGGFSPMGIPFVIQRLKTHYGLLPFSNTLKQFVGSLTALASGFSVGREGPAVHIGAWASSMVGDKLSLPYNSIRTLCACGIAAGISASFHTPLAGVIFVVELMLREYTIAIFVPILLASVTGSLLSELVFGKVPEFSFFQSVNITFEHYPALILMGILLGGLGFLFNRYFLLIQKTTKEVHPAKRIFLAALITVLLGLLVPYCMGTGIGAISFALEHQGDLMLVTSLLIAKMLATVVALGLGVPGGIIGPILGIGAIAGVIVAGLSNYILPTGSVVDEFSLVAMAGFMAATLHAPLAAVVAVIELSGQLQATLPSMVVITFAYLVSSQFFKSRSLFLMQLEQQDIGYLHTPIEHSLQKIGVLAHFNTKVEVVDSLDSIMIHDLLSRDDIDYVIHFDKQSHKYKLVELEMFDYSNSFSYSESTEHPKFQLLEMKGISSQETLAAAYNALVSKRKGAVYIFDQSDTSSPEKKVLGILPFYTLRMLLNKGKI